MGSTDQTQFWTPDEIVTTFAEHGVTITTGAATDLFHATHGHSVLVAAAMSTQGAGTACDDANAAIRAARRAAHDELVADLPPSWIPLIHYLAISNTASLAEVDLRDDSDLLSPLLQGRFVTSETIDSEACVALMPALAHAVRDKLIDEDVRQLRRQIAQARFQLGVLDCGLAEAFDLGDFRLCAEIMEQWSIPMATGRFRDLSTQVLLELPPALAEEFPTLGHRLELYGRLRVASTPIDIPTRPTDIEAACRDGKALAIMRETFYALCTRQRFDAADAAAIAQRAAPLVDHSMQVDGGATAALAPLWYLHAGIARHRMGDLSGARHFYRSGWEYRKADEFGYVQRDLASKLALLTAFDGDTRQAEAWLEETAALDVAPWISERLRVWVGHCDALARHALAADRLDLAELSAWAELGPRQDPFDAFWAFVVWIQARYAILSGRANLVAGIVEDGQRRYATIARGPGLHQDQLAEVSADAMLALGRGTEAAAHLKAMSLGSVHGRVVETRLKLLTGDAEEAQRLAADYRGLSDTRTRDVAELALLEAAASLLLDEEQHARTAARLAARLAKQRNDHRVFATVSCDVLSALATLAPEVGEQVLVLDQAEVAPIYPDAVHLVELSQRERVVLQALHDGGTLPQIAESLFVSRNTIKAQLRSIYSKLGVTSRTEAVVAARRLGLLD